MGSCIYVPDIECDSCVKVITRRLEQSKIRDFRVTKDAVELADATCCDQALRIIKAAGYRASLEPFERKTLRERIRHFKENRQLYRIETLGLQNSVAVFITLLALLAGAYILFFRNIDNFINIYSWWLFYLIISITSLGTAVWHYTAYKGKITCMTGMMIGMTFGMQTGMMIGAVIGATNGFFWGAMVGMVLGTSVGVLTGKCCGVMGIMEGAMAGLMGGTMGPMITVMMFSDNVLWFMPLYMLINIGIIIGLSYMLYEEVVEGRKVAVRPLDTMTMLLLSIIVTTLLVLLMIYGPTSALIRF